MTSSFGRPTPRGLCRGRNVRLRPPSARGWGSQAHRAHCPQGESSGWGLTGGRREQGACWEQLVRRVKRAGSRTLWGGLVTQLRGRGAGRRASATLQQEMGLLRGLIRSSQAPDAPRCLPPSKGVALVWKLWWVFKVSPAVSYSFQLNRRFFLKGDLWETQLQGCHVAFWKIFILITLVVV